jgi:hypothetical protein
MILFIDSALSAEVYKKNMFTLLEKIEFEEAI